MTREEHMDWVKTKALEYVDDNDLTNAFASIVSNLSKHPETKNHTAFQLGEMLLIAGHLDTANKMRDFIEGIN